MPKNESFQVIYEGDSVREGIIDVRELSNSLMALGELVSSVNQYTSGGATTANLKIHAEFKKGSFGVFLEIDQQWIQSVVSLFSGEKATAGANIIQLLGFGSAATFGYGLFRLIRWLKNKKPKSVSDVPGDPGSVKIANTEGNVQVVNKNVFNIYENPGIRNAARHFLEPLKKEGVDNIGIDYKKKRTLNIPEADVGYFDKSDEESGEYVTETTALVKLVSVSFKHTNMWKFNDGQSTFNARILDEEFKKKVDGREITFGNNDKMLVRLKTKQWYENDTLKKKNYVIEVLEYIPKPQQNDLPFSD